MLRGAAARDEAGALKNVEVPGEGWSADAQRAGQVIHWRFAMLEPGQNAAANRVRESGKGSIKVLHYFTLLLINIYVK